METILSSTLYVRGVIELGSRQHSCNLTNMHWKASACLGLCVAMVPESYHCQTFKPLIESGRLLAISINTFQLPGVIIYLNCLSRCDIFSFSSAEPILILTCRSLLSLEHICLSASKLSFLKSLVSKPDNLSLFLSYFLCLDYYLAWAITFVLCLKILSVLCM
jgi:hypothetical protein